MSIITGILALVILTAALVLFVPPRILATALKSFVPIGLLVAGAGLMLTRQAALGSMLLFVGITLWRRMRGVQTLRSPSQGPQRSSVRSAALEMELDHDSGAMNGLVLVGQFEGQVLDEMGEDELGSLRTEIMDDGESLALLDAYLDRRFAGWREDAEADAGAGEAGTASTGPMGKEEAYEVLGLTADATVADIRQAHRRLMKAAHPDSGGSTFLASKINEAKDVLLRSHS